MRKNYVFRFSIRIQDDTDETDVMIFGKEAEYFLGVTANQFAHDEMIRKRVEGRLSNLCGRIYHETNDNNTYKNIIQSSSSSSSSSSTSSSASDQILSVTGKRKYRKKQNQDDNDKNNDKNTNTENQIPIPHHQYPVPETMDFNILTYLTKQISPQTGAQVLKVALTRTFIGC